MEIDYKSHGEELLRYLGLSGPANIPIPLELIARDLGYEPVDFKPNNDKQRRVSGAVNHGKRVIYINSEESLGRRRFILAHEIGHVILHSGEDAIDYRKEINPDPQEINPREVAANQFAAQLLMPSYPFQAHANRYSTIELSRLYGASLQAVEFRKKYLSES